MKSVALINQLQQKYKSLNPIMDERMRRQWAATEALSIGRGGVTAVAIATGMSRNTVDAGIREIRTRENNTDSRLES